MTNLKDLKDSLSKEATGMTRDEAFAKGLCIVCKKPPRWYSDAGRKEYRISGTCEYCFDAMFEEIENHES